MKVYVLTHCTWTSYGSMLQALGLKKALCDLGIESEILYEKDLRPIRLNRVKSPGQKVLFAIHKRAYMTYYRKNLQFLTSNFDIHHFKDYDDLCRNYPRGGIYLAGSDQVWHPRMYSISFFLDFVRGNGERKVSYAAGIGQDTIPEEKLSAYQQYLSDYDALSIREEKNRAAIAELTKKEVLVHIDPTFLIQADRWREYEEEYPIKKPYILVYLIYMNDDINQKLVELSKKTRLPVYAIKPLPSRAYCDKALYDVGTTEFLWLIDHAEYVVTSSFHGFAFSVLFNKKVSAVVNPKARARFDQLNEILSVPLVEIEDLPDTDAFNYKIINQKIEEERNKGFDYLKKILT